MKVLLDFGLKEGVQDGIGTYAANLAQALCDLPGIEVQIQPDKIWNGRLSWPPFGLRKFLYLAWNNLILPRTVRSHQPQILHGMNMVIPFRSLAGCLPVVTIYDMAYMRFPETIPAHIRLYYQLLIPRVAQHAKHIITISEFTKQEVMNLLGVPENKISVTPLACKHSFYEPLRQDKTAVLHHLGLPERFILSIGTVEPRKNLVRLIQAFSQAVEHPGFDLELVVVGMSGWLTQPIFQELSRSQAAKKIKFIGSASNETLKALYQTAEFVAYPSLYEGFGLPVLEAMSLGVPVLTSNSSSLPEVAGDAAVLVNPLQVDEIRDGLVELATNPELRQLLGQKGLTHATNFSWHQTAQQTVAIYQNLLP